MKFHHIQSRRDVFQSRYFDLQISHRYLVELKDSLKIETTAYEHFLCNKRIDLAIDISTMIGCPMKCIFCASSTIKYKRNLTIEEIVNQVKRMIKNHATSDLNQITCSFQGIGEPSLVAENILAASMELVDYDKRIVISISTICSNIDGLKKIYNSSIIFDNFQLTMCGTTRDISKSIMPNAMNPEDILNVIEELLKLENIKKVKINYILLKNKNDRDEDLHRLVTMFKNRKITVKISFLNYTTGCFFNQLESSGQVMANKYRDELVKNNIDSFIFGSLDDIKISCGQLLEVTS